MIRGLDFCVKLKLEVEDFSALVFVVDREELRGVECACQDGNRGESVPDGVLEDDAFVLGKALFADSFDDFVRFRVSLTFLSLLGVEGEVSRVGHGETGLGLVQFFVVVGSGFLELGGVAVAFFVVFSIGFRLVVEFLFF
jgi:hypothetical protein